MVSRPIRGMASYEGMAVVRDLDYAQLADDRFPVSRVAEFVAAATAAVTARYPGVRVVAFGHVGDGNIHFNLSQPAAAGGQKDAAFAAAREPLARLIHDLAVSLGGSFSAEHGIGRLKRDELRRYRSAAELDVMRRIKSALDPKGLCNPGKVL